MLALRVFHVFGALAEFERDLVRERTLAGLAAARARGRLGGRPRTLSPRKVEQLRTFAADKHNSVTEICQMSDKNYCATRAICHGSGSSGIYD